MCGLQWYDIQDLLAGRACSTCERLCAPLMVLMLMTLPDPHLEPYHLSSGILYNIEMKVDTDIVGLSQGPWSGGVFKPPGNEMAGPHDCQVIR